jgi:hypothetical protein
MRGTAMALAALATGLPDPGSNADPAVARALSRMLAPSITAGRRDLEHGVHRPYRIAVAVSSMKRKLMSGVRQRSRSTFLNVALHAQPIILLLAQPGDLRTMVRRHRRRL